MLEYKIEFEAKKLLIDEYFINDEELKKQMVEVAEGINNRIPRLNHSLECRNIKLYRTNKQTLMKFIDTKQKELVENANNFTCEQEDINALKDFFDSVCFHLKRYDPPLTEETAQEKEENIKKESSLKVQQQAMANDAEFLQTLKRVKENAQQRNKYGVKAYFVYAWPEKDFQSREDWVQSKFLPTLYNHLKAAGIEPIWDRKDNDAGNNLSEFMSSILDKADYVLVFGTESLRYKLLQDTYAITFEEKLIKLKWLSDLRSGIIKTGKTTLIPYVLTGTRETSFTNNFIISNFQALTIRAWRTGEYKNVLLSLISQLYQVDNVLNWLNTDRTSFFRLANDNETVSNDSNNSKEVSLTNGLVK